MSKANPSTSAELDNLTLACGMRTLAWLIEAQADRFANSGHHGDERRFRDLARSLRINADSVQPAE